MSLHLRAQVLVLAWLDATAGGCGAGPRTEAYRQGPIRIPAEEYRRRYADRQKWLQQFGKEQMGAAETEKALAASEQQYVARETQRYRGAYQSAGISGLGITGGKASIAELTRIAANAQDPAQVAARQALERIRQRLR